MNDIKVLPPRPGACKTCAVKHRPEEPHDLKSLYYQVKFYRKFKRFPTAEDAMSHCSEEVKTALRAQISDRSSDI